MAVDLRKSCPTFVKYVSEILSSDNKKQMWIPEDFAHGFLTISKTSESLYKTTNYFLKFYVPYHGSIKTVFISFLLS